MSVNTRRCVSAIATASTAAALALFGAGAAHAATTNYVALGDSYSSGVGAGNYTSASGSCDQSTNAYPYLYDSAYAPTFTDEACSGAKTSDVISSQLGALSSSTTLVSMTIGGNDVGFTTVMEDCILGSDSDCQSDVASAESYAENTLPGLLDTTYSDIRKDAPNAHVVIMGYPEFYDLSMSSICVGLSTTDRTALNNAADTLDGVIQTAAQNAGDSYADVRGRFQGHELCDYFSDEWLHSVNVSDVTESYHPNADGHADGYLPAMDSVTG